MPGLWTSLPALPPAGRATHADAPFALRQTDRLLDKTPRAGNHFVSRPRWRVIFLDKRQKAIPRTVLFHMKQNGASEMPSPGSRQKGGHGSGSPNAFRFEPWAFPFSAGSRYG